MKILAATFEVSDPLNGSLIVEFCFAPPIARVWERAAFGSDRPPLLEFPNAQRQHKPCATHVRQLIALAFREPPPGWQPHATPTKTKRSKLKMI